jgi:hypothetical protein
MVENKIGVILVTQKDEIVGIWSEKEQVGINYMIFEA